ncbi:MAG TPA: hypothetical protein VHB97_06370, partial [Polyangia bacterium]|nr:hypothetical protein [Polyangia bacterium]
MAAALPAAAVEPPRPSPAPNAPAKAGEPNWFTRELVARQARFDKEGRRPQALVPLLGIITDLWDGLDDRAPLVALLDRAVGSTAARADVKARAAFVRSLVLDRLGKTSDAEAERAKLGLLTQFWVVGPFDNEGRTGHATVFGPEKQLLTPPRADAKFDGKERSVSWRRMPAIATQGMVSLDAMLRPDTNVTAYLTTMVHVPKATRAALRVGSSGAIAAWVNTTRVLSRDVYRPVRIDQDVVPVQLAAGWNRVTIKLSTLDNAWSLFARLSAPDGGPLHDLESSIAPDTFALVAKKPTPIAHFAVADLRRELEAATRQHPRDAAAWRDLGLYLLHVAPDDPEQRTAAQALEKAAKLAPSP